MSPGFFVPPSQEYRPLWQGPAAISNIGGRPPKKVGKITVYTVHKSRKTPKKLGKSLFTLFTNHENSLKKLGGKSLFTLFTNHEKPLKKLGKSLFQLFQNHENPLKSRENRCFRRIVQNVPKKVGQIIVPLFHFSVKRAQSINNQSFRGGTMRNNVEQSLFHP